MYNSRLYYVFHEFELETETETEKTLDSQTDRQTEGQREAETDKEKEVLTVQPQFSFFNHMLVFSKRKIEMERERDK